MSDRDTDTIVVTASVEVERNSMGRAIDEVENAEVYGNAGEPLDLEVEDAHRACARDGCMQPAHPHAEYCSKECNHAVSEDN